jgi:hypothetical protein
MQRAIPGVLWVSLIALGLFSVIQFLIGIAQMNLVILIAVAVNVLLIFGLYHGHRWAFVVTLVFGVLGIVMTLARSPAVGLGVLVGNGFVLVPMVLAKDFFWGPRATAPAPRPNYCGRCGHDLRGVADPYCPNCRKEIRTADSRML